MVKLAVGLVAACVVVLLLVNWSRAEGDAAISAEAERMTGPLDVTMTTLDGQKVNLAEEYDGKVVLLVNVASKCGYTPQYAGLQSLHERYADQGLAIVGVPCNQFGGQEPGTADQIADFCQKNYGVQFDMLAKVEVNGEGACPLYQFLTSKEKNPEFAGRIKWNFTKFLLNRNGQVVARFESRTRPESDEVTGSIERELSQPAG